MQLTVDILTIIVDSLIILFVLLLIICVSMMIGMFRRINRSLDSMLDLRFWFSIIRGIPSAYRKSSRYKKQ